MAKKMGVDLASAPQEDLNRVYTSAIAGREIKKDEKGYLGGEVTDKVNVYAQQFGGKPVPATATPATATPATPATATPVPAASTPATPPSGTVPAAVKPAPPATAPATAPAPAPAATAQTTTPAATSGDSGILSSLRELVELQSKSNRLLNTIAANV